MKIGEFLAELGALPADWDEELACASCGTAILELHSRGTASGRLSVDLVSWYDGRPASASDDIVCPHCGSRAPIARPYMRDPLAAQA